MNSPFQRINQPQVSVALREMAHLLQDIGGLDSHVKTFQVLADRLDQGYFSLVVVGGFNNGKSTILNSLIGTTLLPMGTIPTTSFITIVECAEEDGVLLMSNDGETQHHISLEEFARMCALNDSDENNTFPFKDVAYARINTPHRFCEYGVRLIDTPGLGETSPHHSVLGNLIDQAQAVLFVFSAIQMLSGEEKEFITTFLGEGALPHVFFAVNRIDLLSSKDLETVQRYCRHQLGRHYLDENGEVDEGLYKRRVFFLSAKNALDAHTTNANDPDAYSASGMALLEKELASFFLGPESNTALLSATAQTLARADFNARRQIAMRKAMLTQSLDTLQTNSGERQNHKQEFDEYRQKVMDMLSIAGKRMKGKLYGYLSKEINNLYNRWCDDQHHIKVGQAILQNTLTLLSSKEQQNKLQNALETDLRNFVQETFHRWQSEMPNLLQPEIEHMNQELSIRLNNFQLWLWQAEEGYASGMALPMSEQKQMMANMAINMISGGRDLAKRSTIRLILLSITLTIPSVLARLVSMITLVLVEGKTIITEYQQFEKRLIESMGQALRKHLYESMTEERLLNSHFKDMPSFLRRLKQGQDDCSRYLCSQLDKGLQEQISRFGNGYELTDTFTHKLIVDLNRILLNEPLYSQPTFLRAVSTAEVRSILKWPWLWEKEADRMNRTLLAEAYPQEIVVSLYDQVSNGIDYYIGQVWEQVDAEMQSQMSAASAAVDSIAAQIYADNDQIKIENERLTRLDEQLEKTTLSMFQATFGPSFTQVDLLKWRENYTNWMDKIESAPI